MDWTGDTHRVRGRRRARLRRRGRRAAGTGGALDADRRRRAPSPRPHRPRRHRPQADRLRGDPRPGAGAGPRVRGRGHRRGRPRRPPAQPGRRRDGRLQRLPHRVVAGGVHRRRGGRLAGDARPRCGPCPRWATVPSATGGCRWAPSSAYPWPRPSPASRWPCSGSWDWSARPASAWPPTPPPSCARCCSSSSGTTRSSPGTAIFELFDALGSRDKRLHASPGDHAAVPSEEFVFSARFLARHLAPGADDLT